MKQIKVLLAALVFVIAACRSIPNDVAVAVDDGLEASTAALVIASDTLDKIEVRSNELNDSYVTAVYAEWRAHIATTTVARDVIARYLNESKADANVTGPFAAGTQLLTDMNAGFSKINQFWGQMVDPSFDAQAIHHYLLCPGFSYCGTSQPILCHW